MFKRLRRWFEHHHKWPIKQIGQAVYWLRTHTYNKYHMIDCRNPRNGYKWGWIDRSEVILFANMAILVEYLEKEAHQIDWTWCPEIIETKKEMDAIYQWWTHDRKVEHDIYDALLTKAYGFENCTVFEPTEDPRLAALRFTKEGDPEWEADCTKCRELERALEEKDEEMMIRLIKIRKVLWS